MDGIISMNDTIMTQTSLALVIPDKAFRERVTKSLNSDYARSEYTSLESVLSDTTESRPQLIICHQALFPDDDYSQLGLLAHNCKSSRILILGPSRPMTTQIAALKQGARGYFNEQLPLTKLNEALSLVLHGEVWVERHVISGLIDELTHKPAISSEQREAIQSLSPKELEAATLVSHGATNKMIAKSMGITERTVKAHLTAIFQKMNIPDRLSLAIFFRELR